MTTLTANEIAARAGGDVVGDGQARATSWAFDSRTLEPGACFVALQGSRDGHDFVGAAFDDGAAVAVVDRALDLPLRAGQAIVRSPDALRALQAVARSLRADRPETRVVAVAGSTGKTSTKDLLAAVLAPVGCHANDASYNNEFGLPITICNAPAAARVIVTEMGERIPGDLALLSDIARPEVGVITNVGIAHAEHLGGVAGTAAVLLELVTALPPTGMLVLNADDPSTPRLAAAAAATVVTVGFDDRANVLVSGLEVDDRLHPSFLLDGHRYSVPLHGAHHALNAAMALTVGQRVFDLEASELADLLTATAGGRWRMELVDGGDGVTVLNDSYNANPASMGAALDALAHLAVTGRRIAVLGDMRELGAYHDDAHAEMGQRAAALALDVIVGVGDGGAAIARAAGGAVESHPVPNADAAIVFLNSYVAPGDAVLVKGSRALGLERVAAALLDRTGARA